jgi:hypothetical protein
MKQLITLLLILISVSSFSQENINVVKNISDIFNNTRLYNFSEKLGVNICDYEIVSLNKIVYITDSLEYKGEHIVINSKKFYGSDTLFTPIIKKMRLNPTSYKKIDKNYLFCYYTNDLVYFYYIN